MTSPTCPICQGLVYRDEHGTPGRYCTRTGCGRAHLLTDRRLYAMYVWAVTYPACGGRDALTVYMTTAASPAVEAPDLVEDATVERVYLDDLRQVLTGTEVAELSLSAHRRSLIELIAGPPTRTYGPL